jgi:hypothetical protein
MAEEAEELKPSIDSENDQDEQAAQSSSAESETEEDLLSVVQDAMMSSEDADSQSDEETEEDDEEGEYLASDDESDEESDESFDDVPFHKHPRFKEVINQRNEYKKSADEYDKITGFLSANDLSAEEAAQGFQIMALMKNDPKGALDALYPYVKNLSLATGQTLPDDIRNKVDDGYLDEDAARELSVARSENQRLQQQMEQTSQRQAAQQQTEQLNQLAATVTDWETQTRQSDPDYDLKEAEIDDRVRVLVAERGRPQTPQQAVEMAREAYDAVNQRFAQRFGNKRPMKTASGGKLGGTPTPEPNTLMEAVQAALAQGST